jgi:predicted nucleic acid-binding protein
MIYLDTSILVPLLVREAVSDAIAAWFAKLPQDKLAISEWTCTEFVSAIGIKVRTGQLDADIARESVQAFRQLADESLTVLVPEKADFRRSGQYLERFDLGLRAGDALHLAVAANHGAKVMYSLDRKLVEISRALKIRAQIPV